MMVQMTMTVPDKLAKRLQPIRLWVPAIIELSLVGFKTLATKTASEVIEFLSNNPSPQKVFEYHASDRSQKRLKHLLNLNKAGVLGTIEQLELEEIQKIEHIIIMLKAQISEQLQKEN